MSDEVAGVVFASRGAERRRYGIDRARYEEAREDAIEMAFLARRAIEQRFGIDLSTIRRRMTLVEAPAAWVDDLCVMEGINYEVLRDPEAEVSATWSEAFVGDYVTRLENFVESYRLDYPFVDGEDTAVISLRDDVHHVRAYCETATNNLLFWSDDLSHISSNGDPGWSMTGCALSSAGDELPNCLGVTLAESLGLTQTVGVGPVSPRTIEFGPDHPYCFPTMEPKCPCPTADCGYQIGARLEQEVDLPAGDYRVSWWTRSYQDISGWDSANPPSTFGPNRDAAASIVDVAIAGTVLSPSVGPTVGRVVDSTGANDDWIETFFVVTLMEPTTVALRVGLPSSSLVTDEITIGGLSINAIGGAEFGETLSVDVLVPGGYEPTAATRTTPRETCEDTTGDVFRARSWMRRCERLCDTGFSGTCPASSERDYCFWETEFSVFEEAIDRGAIFGRAGFARGNFNYRVEQIALNFVGQASRDCEGSANPSTCYSAGYIPYSIDHIGPYRIRDYSGNDYDAPLFTGRIQHARGLAAERYITNPLSSADRALLDPYMQRQFRGRPLSGTYRLRIWEDEGVNFDGIEDVQIILNYRYWTRVN